MLRASHSQETPGRDRKVGCRYFGNCVRGVHPNWDPKSQSYIAHMHQAHAATQQAVRTNHQGLSLWLNDTSRWMCATCCTSYSTSRHRSKKCQCDLSSSTPTIIGLQVVAQDEPQDPPGPPPNDGQEDDPPAAADQTEMWVTTMKDMFMSYVPVVEFIYKKVKRQYNRQFQKCCDDLLHAPQDLEAWTRWSLFPKIVLYLPPNLKDAGSMTQIIRARLSRWEAGEWKSLMVECHEAAQTHQSSPIEVSPATTTLRNRTRCLRLARNGRYGDATKALLSLGEAKNKVAVQAALLAQHPQSAAAELPTEPPPQAIQVTAEDVKTALGQFKKGTASGGSGMKAEHLLQAANTLNPEQNDAFLASMTKLVNLLLAGKAPKELAQIIASAPVIPLQKPEGGVRPIAIGEIIRRLVSKTAIAAYREQILDMFVPLQLGIGVPAGAESIVHAVSKLVEDFGLDTAFSMLKVDFKNAFNLVDRKTMFEECRKHFPGLSRWVEYCYGDKPLLWARSLQFFSTEGVQQGDPLGPLLFSLVLNVLIKKIQVACPNALANNWYLDDGVVIGTHEELRTVIALIEEHGPPLGLHLSRSKSEIWWPAPNDTEWLFYPEGIAMVRDDGVKLLGSPIGSADFANRLLLKRIHKIDALFTEVRKLEEPQVQFCLLRSCVGFPKIAFSLRTCPPVHLTECLQLFDGMVYNSLASIIGADLDMQCWQQATLPLSLGGVGITSAPSKAIPAFLGSVAQSMKLQRRILKDENATPRAHFHSCLASYNEMINQPEGAMTLEKLVKDVNPQKTLSVEVDKVAYVALLASVSEASKARIISCASQHSGAWLTVAPNKFLDLDMAPLQFAVCLRYRLGVSVHWEGQICPVCNEEVLDANGKHGVNCKKSGDLIARHNAIREYLAAQCRSAQLSPRTEEGDGRLRPGDVYLPRWAGIQPAAIDVSVVNPLNAGVVSRAATDQGAAAAEAAERKCTKYAPYVAANNVSFIPFIMETFGGLGTDAIMFIKRLATQAARHRGSEYKTEKKHLFQKLSITLQRGIASMLISRMFDPV